MPYMPKAEFVNFTFTINFTFNRSINYSLISSVLTYFFIAYHCNYYILALYCAVSKCASVCMCLCGVVCPACEGNRFCTWDRSFFFSSILSSSASSLSSDLDHILELIFPSHAAKIGSWDCVLNLYSRKTHPDCCPSTSKTTPPIFLAQARTWFTCRRAEEESRTQGERVSKIEWSEEGGGGG